MSLFKFTTYMLFLMIGFSCQQQTGQTSIVSTEGELEEQISEWKDPLFFIDGQLCQHLRKIFQDSQGNLWFGTNVYGIMRYDGERLEYFDESHGLEGGRITGIVEDKEGDIWFGTASGLYKYLPPAGNTEIRFKNYSTAQGLAEEEIWSVLIDEEGLFWVGTMNGVYQFDGKYFRPFELPRATVKDTSAIMSYDRITSIIQDQKGAIWFGRDGFGITHFYQGNFQQITKKNGLANNSISSLMEDQQGNVWIGSMFGGLARWHNGEIIKYPFGKPVKGWEIGALFEDSHSRVWFASENHGIYRYNSTTDSFDHFHKEQGLVTDGILSIYEDQSGRYWLGGWGGLFRYFPSAEDPSQLFKSVTKSGPWN